ncbi:DUF3298 domain-containing protein [Syntrophomonas erecta]
MNDKNLLELKKEYMNIPIPDELEFTVKKALQEGSKIARKRYTRRIWMGVAVASVLLFTVTLNVSPTVAQALAEVPVIKSIVNVLTFREYQVNEETYNADIKVPALEGLGNKTLEDSLNSKYLKENKQLYQDFMADVEDLKANGGGHLGVSSGYEIKTDNEQILSIGRWVVNTVASSSTTMEFDTIDKKNEILITLPSLFKDDRYINTISENIKQQMREQMKADPENVYWVTGSGEELPPESFEKIAPDQNFYINNDGKLVISFDKYEVAPGYMGVVEFVIPTEVVSNLLVSNEYIK